VIVYVETNFVLELAFQQEDHESCRALLDLAEGSPADLELALPAFCIGEAYERQVRRQRERKALHDRLRQELGELARSLPYAARSDEIRDVTRFLVESGEDERGRLNAVLEGLYGAATLVPLDEAVAREARRQEARRGLEPQDALVYASVLCHLRQSAAMGPAAQDERCFVTRDNDFANADIGADLEALGCKILFRFDAALRYARSRLA
jgi:predicted nucleic acid-binding protein